MMADELLEITVADAAAWREWLSEHHETSLRAVGVARLGSCTGGAWGVHALRPLLALPAR